MNLPFFKNSNSTAEVAQGLGEIVVGWPAKHRAQFEARHGKDFEGDFHEVIDEIVYFLGFGTDYAIYCAYKESPKVVAALRSAFAKPLCQYALDHDCKPVIPGGWMADSWIWMPQGPAPAGPGRPLANLDQRFTQYAAALQRGADQEMSIGECVAHLLAGWCMILDVSFLLDTSAMFSEHVIATRDALVSARVRV
jgi:hypothetical protein